MNKPKMSESIMLEAGSTLEHIVKKFKHETKNFLAGNDLDSDLYDALYDYYSDNGEMPYGVAKARDGDPYQWVGNRFADEMQMHGYGRQTDMLNMPGHEHELTELARLAGLSEGSQPFRTPEIGSKLASSDVETFGNKAGRGYSLEKNKDGKWDISNQDKKDHIRSRLGKHVKPAHLPESEINECGDMDMEQHDSMSVSTNMSSDGTKSVNISAQGDKADSLLQMLKMAGMRPYDDHEHAGMTEPEVIMISSEPHDDMHNSMMHDEEMMDEEYANEPEQEYHSIDSILRQGNDLNREKQQFAQSPKLGDNPMAESMLDADLEAMLESILVREEMTDVLKAEQPYRDEKTGKMVTPPKGATMPPADSQFAPGDKRNVQTPKPSVKMKEQMPTDLDLEPETDMPTAQGVKPAALMPGQAAKPAAPTAPMPAAVRGVKPAALMPGQAAKPAAPAVKKPYTIADDPFGNDW
jgi:hypothetical protein